MVFSIRIYILVNIILVLIVTMAQMGNSQLFKREVRISKFDVNSFNSSIMTVVSSGIKQYHGKHMVYCHLIYHEKPYDVIGEVEVFKCKDYYVDCVNVISYEMRDVCKEKPDDLLLWFSSMQTNNGTPKGCQPGEYRFDNITLASDYFGTFFSFPTEKWWELYWKIRMNLYTKEKTRFFYVNLQFYFLQYRSRNRSPRH